MCNVFFALLFPDVDETSSIEPVQLDLSRIYCDPVLTPASLRTSSRRRKKLDRSQHAALDSMLGSGPFRCEVCGKISSTRAKAMGHYRVHTGERPYECEICQRTFSDGSNFKRHRRLHLGSRSDMTVTDVF